MVRIALIALLLLTAGAARPGVVADFSVEVGPPLVKKFAVMNSGIASPAQYARDAPKLAAAGVASVRVDLGLGRDWWAGDLIGGTAGELTYDWSKVDAVTRDLNAAGVAPYWSFCYVPTPLQRVPRDDRTWRLPPTDLAAYAAATRAFAGHFQAAGLTAGPLEVYNEPDFGDFWLGTREAYFELYRAAAPAFRAGAPDTAVGGPALAFDAGWVGPFLDFVKRNDLPLDFFSFHAVSGPPGPTTIERFAMDRVVAIRAGLAADRRFDGTELHLGEWNPYRLDDFQRAAAAGVPAKSALAVRALGDFDLFLNEHDLTLLHWAQGMDPGPRAVKSGLIDFDGTVEPVYFAFAFYNDLPVRRAALKLPEGLGGFAGCERGKAAVLAWNPTGEARGVTVRMEGLAKSGFVAKPQAALEVFSVSDGRLPKLSDGAIAAGEEARVDASRAVERDVTVPARGFVYLRLTNADGAAKQQPPGKLVRVLHHFPTRGGGSYAEFDPRGWTAILGVGGEAGAAPTVGVAVDGLAKALAVDATPAAAVRVRLDFRVKGTFTKSVLLRVGGGGLETLATPFGTRRPADRVVEVGDWSRFTLRPADLAPPGWDGRAVVSFALAGGADAPAVVRLSATR